MADPAHGSAGEPAALRNPVLHPENKFSDDTFVEPKAPGERSSMESEDVGIGISSDLTEDLESLEKDRVDGLMRRAAVEHVRGRSCPLCGRLCLSFSFWLFLYLPTLSFPFHFFPRTFLLVRLLSQEHGCFADVCVLTLMLLLLVSACDPISCALLLIRADL